MKFYIIAKYSISFLDNYKCTYIFGKLNSAKNSKNTKQWLCSM